MAITSISQLKKWFANGQHPTGDRFAAIFDSFFHKSEAYSKEELNAMLSAIPKFDYQVVETLPTTNISSTTVYIVPGTTDPTVFTERIYKNGSWYNIGAQKISLAEYAKKADVPSVIDNLTTDDSANALSAKQGKALFEMATEYDVSAHNDGKAYTLVGTAQAARLFIKYPPSVDGDIIVSLGGDVATVSLSATGHSTPALVAAAIAAETYSGYSVSYASGNDYVDFVADSVGAKVAPGIDLGTTGAVVTIEETTAGADSAVAAVPAGFQRGGLTIAFIDALSGQHVRYSCNGEWSSNIEYWENVPNKVKYLGTLLNIINSEIGISSINLLNPNTCQIDKYLGTTGKVNSIGVNSSKKAWFISDYIQVNGMNITTSGNTSHSGVTCSFAVYDKDLNLLRAITTDTYIYQNGDAFVRTTGKYPDTIMVNYGDSLSPFVSYQTIGEILQKVQGKTNDVYTEVFEHTSNLIDINLLDNGYIDSAVHNGGGKPNYCISDFIPVRKSKNIVHGKGESAYEMNAPFNDFAVYNSSKEFLRVEKGTTYSYQEGDAFVRIAYQHINWRDALNADFKPSANYGNNYLGISGVYASAIDFLINMVARNKENISNAALKYDGDIVPIKNDIQKIKEGLFIESKNLINPDEIVPGYMIENGVAIQTSNNNYCITGFIRVKGKNIIHGNGNSATSIANQFYDIAVYDSGKKRLRNEKGTAYVYQEGDAFVRFAYNYIGWKDALGKDFKPSANYGTQYEPYIEYGKLVPQNMETTTNLVTCKVAKYVTGSDFGGYNAPSDLVVSDERITFSSPDNKTRGISCGNFSPKGSNLVNVKFKLIKSEAEGGNKVPLTLYLYGNGHFITSKAFNEGECLFQFDAASYTVYQGYTSFSIVLAVSSSNPYYPASVIIDHLVIDDAVTDIDGKSLNEVLASIDTTAATNKKKVEELEKTVLDVKSNYLVAPNGKKYSLAINKNGQLVGIPVIPNNILFLGNSLMFGHGTYGMDATAPENDYYHRITSKLQELLGSEQLHADRLYSSPFEHSASDQDLENYFNKLRPLLTDDVQWVNIQVGDNINTDDKFKIFKGKSGEMLASTVRSLAPNARVSWTFAWYYNQERYDAVKAICDKYGITLVDIRDLADKNGNKSHVGNVYMSTPGTRSFDYESYKDNTQTKTLLISFKVGNTLYTSDPLHYESYEDNVAEKKLSVTSTYEMTKSTGASTHPSDAGFEDIAERLLSRMGIADGL